VVQVGAVEFLLGVDFESKECAGVAAMAVAGYYSELARIALDGAFVVVEAALVESALFVEEDCCSCCCCLRSEAIGSCLDSIRTRLKAMIGFAEAVSGSAWRRWLAREANRARA
jgi:hypothetical protein